MDQEFESEADKLQICGFAQQSINNVSRETKLKTYVDLLLKWQKKINLISSNTESEIWQRHIQDSTQLEKYISEDTKTIIDIGSGAGLPGIPLAIATGIKTYLIESDTRKSVFMQEAIRQLGISATVVNQRIEATDIKDIHQPVIITARALASLDEIFKLIYSLLDKNNLHAYKLLLLKGKNVSRETKDAEVNWKFEFESIASETNKDASIIIITKLKPRY